MRTVRILEEAGDTGARRLILERFPYDLVAVELPKPERRLWHPVHGLVMQHVAA
ncbi:MAG TPA: hypothetical protein VL091_08665 [Marinobacter sp.]|nr:hypothetical protein [Marinobacter sp.]